MIQTIDIQKEITATKKRLSLEHKEIKSFSFYNYLNQDKSNLIIDCRFKEEESKLRDSFTLEEFYNLKKFTIQPQTTLYLIINDNQKLKEDKDLEKIRNYIFNESEIKEIFILKETDFSIFKQKFSFFFLNSNSLEIERKLASLKYPFCIEDNKVYTGNFFQSRNFSQLGHLNIKSIITIAKEDDEIIKKNFPRSYFYEMDEANHSELDIVDIVDKIIEEVESGNFPVFIHCFSGQTCSLIACVAYLIKSKNWNITFATAYIMKITQIKNFPPWLYTQLNRVSLKK